MVAVEEKFIEQAIRESAKRLTQEQENCVRSVLTAKGSIVSFAGHAGAGKTTVSKVITRALELGNKRVIGASLGGVAVDKLKESINRESRTLASILHEFELGYGDKMLNSGKHLLKMLARAARKKPTWKRRQYEKIDENTVILVDESGMIDLAMMHPFLKEVERRRAKVVFIGDQAQLSPIGPGNPMAHIDASSLVGELKHNWRQTQVEAKASLMVREGNSAEALKVYQDKGDLIVAKDRAESVKRTVEDWSVQAASTPKHAIILAQTNAEIKTLNHLCQQARIRSGAIGGSSLKVNGSTFHKGDRLIFRKTNNFFGIKNGHRGEVIRIGDDGSLLIKIDGRGQVPTYRERLKAGLLRRPEDKSLIKISAELAAKLDIRLGYASTTYSYQGSQADHVFVLLGGRAQDRNMSYVQLSRSTARTRLYVDRPHAGPEFSSIIKSKDELKVKQNVQDTKPKLELQINQSTEL